MFARLIEIALAWNAVAERHMGRVVMNHSAARALLPPYDTVFADPAHFFEDRFGL